MAEQDSNTEQNTLIDDMGIKISELESSSTQNGAKFQQHTHNSTDSRVLGGPFRSRNFKSGLENATTGLLEGGQGWEIDEFGNATFNNGTFRGGIAALFGTIGGWVITATTLYSVGNTITLNSDGSIYAGQTAYNAGDGWYLGFNGSSNPAFSIGKSTGNRMTWDTSIGILNIVATTEGGLTMTMPGSGSGVQTAGIIINDSNGNPVLKMNNNAFITSFGKSFAAASNTNGDFGDDWFQMFCEIDSEPLGNTTIVTGSFEAPDPSNRILLKKSGPSFGMMMRLVGGSEATAASAGVVDINYPVGIGAYTSDPTVPTDIGHGTGSYKGLLYYNLTSNTLKVCTSSIPASVGTWKSVQFEGTPSARIPTVWAVDVNASGTINTAFYENNGTPGKNGAFTIRDSTSTPIATITFGHGIVTAFTALF